MPCPQTICGDRLCKPLNQPRPEPRAALMEGSPAHRLDLNSPHEPDFLGRDAPQPSSNPGHPRFMV